MSQQDFERNYAKLVTLDICNPCASLWFDGVESLALTPGAVLRLFVVIHDNKPAQRKPVADRLFCPHCRQRLLLTTDMQRATRFRYWRCPGEHGRFITFLEFLREKNFVRPLSAAEVEQLKQSVRTITCSSCGAAVDLNSGSACPYCRAPVSMLDPKQMDTVVQQLKREDAKRQEANRVAIDPALAARLMDDRTKVERSFAQFGDPSSFNFSGPGDLVEAGMAALVAFLKGD